MLYLRLWMLASLIAEAKAVFLSAFETWKGPDQENCSDTNFWPNGLVLSLDSYQQAKNQLLHPPPLLIIHVSIPVHFLRKYIKALLFSYHCTIECRNPNNIIQFFLTASQPWSLNWLHTLSSLPLVNYSAVPHAAFQPPPYTLYTLCPPCSTPSCPFSPHI